MLEPTNYETDYNYEIERTCSSQTMKFYYST